MQRTLQRAECCQHRRIKPRLRRGHHAGRERRGVEPVVGDSDEVGVEPVRQRLGRVGTAQHAQDVGGVPDPGLGRQRRLAFGLPQHGGQQHARSRGDHQGGVEIGAVGQGAHQHANRVERREPGGGAQPIPRRLEHLRPSRPERPGQVAGQGREEPVPQQPQHMLVADPSGQRRERQAADHQPAGQPVDIREHRLGSNHVFKTIVHLAPRFCARIG